MSSVPASTAVGISGVTKRFDDVVAVDDVSLDIRDGEFFALLGPSGCGKTTTLRMIAGLDIPTAGSISIFGDEMVDTPPNKRPVNTVFQQYALFPHLDVTDNVGFGLRMKKVDRAERAARVQEALSLVRLGDLGGRKPSQLSGGQQQRVALARALVNRPKVLLLDEPLGALDLQLRQDMQTELKGLQRELGITFVFVTHDQEEALTMSDRIAVMNHGRVLQTGRPEEIYELPADRFVASFIGRTNLLDGRVSAGDTVVLENGTAVAIDTADAAPGSRVTIGVRPERLRIRGLDDATPHGGLPRSSNGTSLTGVVTDITYLGNALTYTVTVDWVRIEIRTESAEDDRLDVGRDVEITWTEGALRLLDDRTHDDRTHDDGTHDDGTHDGGTSDGGTHDDGTSEVMDRG